ncbi:MAG: phosphatidate cytidylyltransferase [Planctomycetota bacterium]
MTAPPPSKAARILKRTLMGSTLVACVAGLLFWTSRSEDGHPILFAGSAILLVALWETSRMGTLALRDFLPALLIPAIGVIRLGSAAIEGSGTGFALAYASSAALAAAAYAMLFSLRRLARGILIARVLTYLVLGAIVLFVTDEPSQVRDRLGPGALALAILLATSLPFVLRQPGAGRGLAITVGLAIWIAPPLPALWYVWDAWSIGGLVALLVCSKIGDTAGYYVGSAIGRHHPFPRISPGKTTEGCLGSFAAATLAGGASVALDLLPGDLVHGLLAGAVVNLAAQAGDLLESFVKRRAGVKDSSAMLGPSGGLLDQIDSLLLSVPVALALWPWILHAHAGSH